MKRKSQKLTVLLLREDIAEFGDAIREEKEVEWLEACDDIGFDGRFAFRPSYTHPPRWVEFVAPAIEGEIDRAFNSSTYAILFVAAGGRKFACTFGYGRSLLKPDAYELGFGLRVTLNRIDPSQLRTLDMLAYEDLVITTRRQTSRGSELGSFSLDITTDILRSVVGRPKDLDWVRSIGGKDALTIRTTIGVGDLGDAMLQLLDAYEDDSYKEEFEWIDHLGRVDDKEKADELDSLLVERLRSESWQDVYLAPPEPIDPEREEDFGFSGIHDETRHDDLLLEDYFRGLGEDKRVSMDVKTLKRHRAGVYWTGSEVLDRCWSVYSCLVWEAERDGKLYALLAGTWFQIENSFAEEVWNYVRSIDTTPLDLPPAKKGEWEQDYNRRAASLHANICLLDRKLFVLPGASSSIEFCDLLSLDRQLIHVKRRTHSATLSHLFSQGAVSAEAFLAEQALRQSVRQHLIDTNSSSFLGVVPEGRPDAAEYEIVFAVVDKPVEAWPDALPFFSQLNLMQRAKHLRTLGFQVRLAHIEEATS